MSGELRVECGGVLTLVGNGLLFVVNGFEVILLVDITPVVTACATLAEGLVHARLGLGPVLDYGAGGERAFGASHDGGEGRQFDWPEFI